MLLSSLLTVLPVSVLFRLEGKTGKTAAAAFAGGRVGAEAEAEAVPVRIRGLGRNSTLQSLQILAL